MLVPERTVAEVSAITTKPALLNVSDPKSNVSSTAIDVPARSALPATVRSAVPSSVIDAVESRSRLSAVLVPERTVAESSAIATAPAEFSVSEPKFITSPVVAKPSAIPVPSRSALFVTVSDAEAALVMPAAESRSRLSAVLVPERTVSVSSAMATEPVEFTVREPKFIASPV